MKSKCEWERKGKRQPQTNLKVKKCWNKHKMTLSLSWISDTKSVAMWMFDYNHSVQHHYTYINSLIRCLYIDVSACLYSHWIVYLNFTFITSDLQCKSQRNRYQKISTTKEAGKTKKTALKDPKRCIESTLFCFLDLK